MSLDPNPENHLDFDELFETHFLRIYRYFRIRVGGDELARDLTAETFLRAFTHRTSYESQLAPFTAWLLGIARNLLIDAYRRNGRRRFEEPLENISHEGDTDSPELEVLRSEKLDEVKEAMKLLAPRERELIALKLGGALTNKEIAGIYGISAANAAVILHRGIKKLRALLTGEGYKDG